MEVLCESSNPNSSHGIPEQKKNQIEIEGHTCGLTFIQIFTLTKSQNCKQSKYSRIGE